LGLQSYKNTGKELTLVMHVGIFKPRLLSWYQGLKNDKKGWKFGMSS